MFNNSDMIIKNMCTTTLDTEWQIYSPFMNLYDLYDSDIMIIPHVRSKP